MIVALEMREAIIKTRTFLTNGKVMELRLYFRPCSVAAFRDVTDAALAELARYQLTLNLDQVGLHDAGFVERLIQGGWKAAKN